MSKTNRDNFDFFNKVDLDIEEKPKEIDLKFWQLSKGSKFFGRGTGQSRDGHMCRRCGAIVADPTTHAKWHEEIEKMIVKEIKISSSY